MKTSSTTTSLFASLVLVAAAFGPIRAAEVNESAREIPVAYEVDVLIVVSSSIVVRDSSPARLRIAAFSAT